MCGLSLELLPWHHQDGVGGQSMDRRSRDSRETSAEAPVSGGWETPRR